MERRLLRTIQVGAPQDITVEQIQKIAESDDTDFTTAVLARSALLVLQHDDTKLISYSELFESVLNRLVNDGSPYQPLAGLPNFRGKETLFAMVYAMVMSGQQELAVDILAKHSLTGSRYKQGVVLSALRNVGTPRAISVIQQYSEKGQDRNLADTTLADEDYPVLFEMHDRWGLVLPEERGRKNLTFIVQSGCNQRGALAGYWLGFFAPNPDPRAEVEELEALKGFVRTNTETCGMMEHVIALKSLALRSAETIDYWKRLAQRTPNVWERHQIVINAFGRWGREFAPAALELLKTDTAQYVQWELLNGNVVTRQGHEYRNYWDIWMPANILVAQEYNPALGRPAMEPMELDAMLDWLDAGAKPRDPVVLNHMIYHLLEFTTGSDTRRLLRIFNALPQRNQNWWILQTLHDPAALPLLKYWSTLPAPQDQRDTLENIIGSLGGRSMNRGTTSQSCCEATEACLVKQLREGDSSAEMNDVAIRSEEDARKWLSGGAAAGDKFKIHFTDELKRSAIVRRGDGAQENWQYLYDCWRNTDKPRSDVTTH